jgi:putative polyhydroxyalkanoate system protein
MPKIEISKKHNFSKEEARTKVDQVANDLKDKYGLKTSWESEDLLKFSRTGAKGQISLEEGAVTVKLDLSMVLSALKTKAEQRINAKLNEEFS